jgi:hypothetical protein
VGTFAPRQPEGRRNDRPKGDNTSATPKSRLIRASPTSLRFLAVAAQSTSAVRPRAHRREPGTPALWTRRQLSRPLRGPRSTCHSVRSWFGFRRASSPRSRRSRKRAWRGREFRDRPRRHRQMLCSLVVHRPGGRLQQSGAVAGSIGPPRSALVRPLRVCPVRRSPSTSRPASATPLPLIPSDQTSEAVSQPNVIA